MKTTIGVIALGLLVGACAGDRGGVPAAEIRSMSDDQISVVYYESISGMGGATQIAQEHCDTRRAAPTGKTAGGSAPNTMVASFDCKVIE